MRNAPDPERLEVPSDVFAKELETINARRETVGLDRVDGERPGAELGLVGLALSGGGIRSSTFSLGVVQALAEADVFRRVDYVSTVSGGGYTGSMLSSVLNEPAATPADAADPEAFPLRKPAGRPEPAPLKHLRNGSRYLSPGGLLDRLRLPAVFLRGIALNGLLLLPWLMLAVIVTELVHEWWWRADLSWLGVLDPMGPIREHDRPGVIIVLAVAVAIAYTVLLPAGRMRSWSYKNLRDLVFTGILVAVVAALLLRLLFYLIELAIEVPLTGEGGLYDVLEENVNAGVWLAVAGGAVGSVLVIRAASRLSQSFSKLVLYSASLLAPVLILGAYLLLCVAQLDSPFIRRDVFWLESFGQERGFGTIHLSNDFAAALRRRDILYPPPPGGVEGWFVRGDAASGRPDTWLLKKPEGEIERLLWAFARQHQVAGLPYSIPMERRARHEGLRTIEARLAAMPGHILGELERPAAAIGWSAAELGRSRYYRFVREGDEVRIDGAGDVRPLRYADFALIGVPPRFTAHLLDDAFLKALRSRSIHYTQPVTIAYGPRTPEGPACWYLEKASEAQRRSRLAAYDELVARLPAVRPEAADRELARLLEIEEETKHLPAGALAAAVSAARLALDEGLPARTPGELESDLDDGQIEQGCRFYRLRPRGSRVELVGAKLRFGGAPSAAVLLPDWVFFGLAVALLVLNFMFLNVNRSSLHSFYRDRLSRLYLFKLRRGSEGLEVDAARDNDDLGLTDLNAEGSTAPYHLINATLNVQGSDDAAVRGRRAGFFVFSRHYCGGPITGYCETAALEAVDPHVNLGTAMAISAAAAAPNMGTTTIPALVFAMTMLNLRLGYWLPNPRAVREHWPRLRLRLAPGSLYLAREARGALTADGPYVNVSDGGHLENLAVYELLRRRCKLVIAVDGEADEEMGFHGLITLIRLARIDLGIEIDIDLAQLALQDSRSSAHWTVGTIRYGAGEDGAAETGRMLYVKSSVTGDEDPFVAKYRTDNVSFPHESTADQFFDELQFEAYRTLGYHVGDGLVRDSAVAALPGFADAARQLDSASEPGAVDGR